MSASLSEQAAGVLHGIATIPVEDLDLSAPFTRDLMEIKNKYLSASTAEYIEGNPDFGIDDHNEAVRIAAEVRRRMDKDDEYNSFEGIFIDQVLEEERNA